MITAPKKNFRATRYSADQTFEKLAAVHQRVSNAESTDKIVAELEQLSHNQHRLTFPLFQYFFTGMVWLVLLIALGWLALVAFASQQQVYAWLGATLGMPPPDGFFALGILIGAALVWLIPVTKTWRAMRDSFGGLRSCLNWKEDLRSSVSEAAVTLLHDRTYPDYDAYEQAAYWGQRFNHFWQGHENRYIDYLEEVSWPGSDASEDIPEGRAQQYRFNYTVVTTYTDTDSNGNSTTRTVRTEHSSYGLVIPFAHSHWLLLEYAIFKNGIWRPNHPALRSQYKVHAHDQLAASHMMKPSAELALAEIARISGGLKIEFAEGYLHLEMPGWVDLSATAPPTEVRSLIQWVKDIRTSSTLSALITLVADLRRHIK